MTKQSRPAVFFDRDGVLNHDAGYVHTPEAFVWTDEAVEAVRQVNDAGWLAIVVTNQSGIARGYYGPEDVTRLHQWMQHELGRRGAHIDAYYYCPHHEDGCKAELAIECSCRKPQPGMLLTAMDDWGVDRERSLLIGDKASDLEAARRAGIRGYLYKGGSLLRLVREAMAASGQPPHTTTCSKTSSTP
ncbi:MAG TPA: HAD family hydrolase [Solidesulfovibrio magneticus]|nr:HAD family hydrolase [Solidesulfovibrio magneticus]